MCYSEWCRVFSKYLLKYTLVYVKVRIDYERKYWHYNTGTIILP